VTCSKQEDVRHGSRGSTNPYHLSFRNPPRASSRGGKRHCILSVRAAALRRCVLRSVRCDAYSNRAQTRPGRPKQAFFTTDQVAYSKQLVARARGLNDSAYFARCRPRARSARIPSEHSNG